MKKITWFSSIEEKIWGDKIESNRYLATLSIMTAAVLGAFLGGSSALNDMFDWSVEFTVPALAGALCIFASINMAESIWACPTIGITVARTALVTLLIALAAVVGAVVAVVVIVIVCLWLLLMVASVALGGSSGSSGKRRGTLDDGTEVEESGRGLTGEVYYKDRHGNEYEGSVGSDIVHKL